MDILSVGDIVLVAFNEGQVQTPCVIGKLYLGSTAEKNSTAGSIVGNTLDIAEQASLPITTKLTTASQTVSTNLQASNYNSILDIANDCYCIYAENRCVIISKMYIPELILVIITAFASLY